MKRIVAWLRAITLGHVKSYVKLAAWMFVDSTVSTVPYGIMLIATLYFLTPLLNPGAPLPLGRMAILCGVLLAQAVAYYFVSKRTYIVACVGASKVIENARLSMGEKLRTLPMGFFSRRDAGDLTTMLLRDYNTVENNFTHMLPQVTVTVVRLLMAVVVFGLMDARMMVSLVGVIPLSLPMLYLSYRLSKRHSEKLLAVQQESNARTLEFLAGMQTLKAYGQSGTRFDALQRAFDKQRKSSIALEASIAPVGMLGRFILNCGTAVVMLAGTHFFLQGSLSAVQLILFLMASLTLYQPVISLFFFIADYTRLTRSAMRIREVMDEKPLPEPAQDAAPKDYAIAFDDVSFGYGHKEVLHRVRFDIPAKRLTALVGASGSGKSTVTRLIARFWDVNAGAIRMGGIPLTGMKADTLLSKVAMVFQDVYLFHDTVANNIAMGREGATREEVVAAAKKAAAHAFITALPNGYDTMVGEGGSTLSGGEKQRISIARALLKDAPVILLDEATASLDPENEVLIQHAINALVKDKTVVVIAHRLQSIRNADHIIVLREGQVAQQGTHDSLLGQEGIYRNLWNEQAQAGSWKLGS